MKRFLTTVTAVNIALGTLYGGVHKLTNQIEQPIVETISEIHEEIHEDTWELPTAKTRNDRYIKDSLGVFGLTFYIPDSKWGYSTSTGTRSVHKKTCAVDPSVIPLGSRIRIVGDNGEVLELLACDIGNGIKGSRIDIFFDSKSYGGVQAGYDWIAKFGTIHSVYLLEE